MKFYVLILSFLLPMCVFSQWTEDYNVNTPVADGPTDDIQSIGTYDGQTYVIFYDTSNGYQLRVQLLDQDGNPMFGTNGMLANDTAAPASWTITRSSAVDEDGNLYIGFSSTEDGDGYINKISPDGTQLFGDSGIIIPDGWDIKILLQPDGGLIAGYLNITSGDAQLIKYDANGNPVWDQPLTITGPSGESCVVGEMAELSDGSFILLYHVKAGFGINSMMWAQRFDTDANPLWVNSIQVSTQTLASNRRYPILQDGDTVYWGYYGSTGNRFDSFLQRINPDGSLPWGADGASFAVDDSRYEMNTSIAFDETSSVIWATSTLSDTNQSLFGQAIQKYDKTTGEPLLGENAKIIFPVSADAWVAVGNMRLVNNQPLILFSNGISNGVNSIQLGVTYLDENGDFVWENQYEMIATADSNKFRVDFTENVEGQSVAVWADNRAGTYRAFAQNFVVEDATMHIGNVHQATTALYPNPTTGIVHIRSTNPVAMTEIYDLSGKLLQQSKNVQSADLRNMPKGTYLLKVTDTKGSTKSFKIVKK